MPASLALILTWQWFFDAGSCGRQLPHSLLVVLILRQPALAGKHVARFAAHALHLHLEKRRWQFKKKTIKKNETRMTPTHFQSLEYLVQFSLRWYLGKAHMCSICLSEISPTLPLKRFQCSSDRRWPSLILSSKMSSASSFHTSLLQVITGVMS